MKKIKLTVRHLKDFSQATYQDVPCDGYATDTPGLAVCHRLQRDADGKYRPTDQRWGVTHIESGLLIEPRGIHIYTRKNALAIARDLGPLTDWTQKSRELEKSQTLGRQVRAVFEPYRKKDVKE